MMKPIKILKISILSSLFFLAACSANVKDADTGAADYKAAVVSTTKAADKAKSVGGEWRDLRWKKSSFVKYTDASGKKHKASYMKAAELAAKDGNYVKALSLLKTAKFQADMGYQQAMEQKTAGPRF